MDPSKILAEVDMFQPRSPNAFYTWVISKCRELSSSPEAKAFARSGARLPKKLYDELFPLALFVHREFTNASVVTIEPHLGNDNYDAKITTQNARGASTTFVETTYAKDGYDESLRMEVLAKEGGVSLTGPITKSGRRGSPDRIVTVECEAAEHSETLESYLQLVESRVKAKAKVHYGANHLLLVAVDDYLPLVQDYDWPTLDNRARAWLACYQLDFARLVFVGVAGRLWLSYALPHATARVDAL